MAATVVRLWDGLRNALTGAGTGRDARIANAYAWAPLTQQQIIAAYRGSGLMRKIIGIPALDMVREWRDWKAEADQITKLEAEEKRLGLRNKVRTAEVLRGLGGGAFILGLPGPPNQAALKIAEGGLAYIHVVSRWHLSFTDLQDDAREPNYGEPLMWRLNSSGGQVDIHPSRIVAFKADTAATLATYGSADLIEGFWGESRVAQVLDAVTDCDEARAAFAALLRKARLTRIGIPNLSDIVATEGGSAKIQARLEMIALAESLHNAAIYDAGGGTPDSPGEKIDDVDYDFAGAKDVLNAYAEFAAAIADIPATRLLGRAPEGMNASGDSQQADWRKMVKAKQTLDLDPCMERIDAYLVPSALGSKPAEVWHEWAPLDSPGEKENAERFKLQTEAIEKLANGAYMPERALNRGVQSLMIEEGYLPELETALEEIPDEERYGIEAEPEPAEIDDPNGVEGGDPDQTAGGGAQPDQVPPRRAANDAKPIPLYVRRDLLNADELIAWAKAQGFTSTLPASDMHVTVLFSRTPVDPIKMGETWSSDDKGRLRIKPGGPRAVERLGESAVVLLFVSNELTWRHRSMIEAGASHDFEDYAPHVTISYEVPADLDLDAIKPFIGELRFGPEIFKPLDLDWKSKISESE